MGYNPLNDIHSHIPPCSHAGPERQFWKEVVTATVEYLLSLVNLFASMTQFIHLVNYMFLYICKYFGVNVKGAIMASQPSHMHHLSAVVAQFSNG